jgi:hypothetical protein
MMMCMAPFPKEDARKERSCRKYCFAYETVFLLMYIAKMCIWSVSMIPMQPTDILYYDSDKRFHQFHFCLTL